MNWSVRFALKGWLSGSALPRAMNISSLAQQPPELVLGHHLKALKFRIENFLKKLKSASRPTLEINHLDPIIGEAIAYALLKLNSGKGDHRAYMTAFTINSMGLNGVLLA